MGVLNTVWVDDASALEAAETIVKATVHDVNETCSRFRPDSELSILNRSAGRGPVAVSPLLEEAVGAALRAAGMTGGLVDPTVGKQVEEIGYRVSFGEMEREGPALDLKVRAVRGWRSVAVDARKHTIDLPDGVALDLGATGKAWAADRAAGAVAERLDVGVLVECGGDIAVRGPAPDGGWPVHVAEDIDAAGQDIALADGGLATSGVTSRRWRRGTTDLHDIIDPTTGLPVETPWAIVTVAAATCLEANAASTAALIMGEAAVEWLGSYRLPSRLVRHDGRVCLAGGWCA